MKSKRKLSSASRPGSLLSSAVRPSGRLSSGIDHPLFQEPAPMNRRQFLHAGAAGLAMTGSDVLAFADATPKRVGLIGCGWYGKCDLFRLIQVAPVEVVSLCD